MALTISIWDSVGEIGYEQKTTFWMDFSIADNFGNAAIRDTYRRAFSEWKSDCVYFTELVMILNHKSWEWYGRGNEERAELYSELYYEASDWGYESFTGEELRYFWKTLD